MSQQEFADIVNINRSTYAGYEAEGREPDFATLVLIAKFYQVTTDYLLGLTDFPFSNYILTDDEAFFLNGSLTVYRETKRKHE